MATRADGYGYYGPRYYYPRRVYYGGYYPRYYGARYVGPRILARVRSHYRRGFYGYRRYW